jgi:hypothetical protein
MITLFCVRPKGFNVGNDTIFLGVRHLLRETFGEGLNVVQVPAEPGTTGDPLVGLSARSIHQMNLYGHGVLVGGGNLYENNGLTVDVDALDALRLPMMLFSLSHGRIYDHCHRLAPRTDSMPASVVRALNQHAAISIARDDATTDRLHRLGIEKARTGGCPSLLLAGASTVPVTPSPAPGGTLVAVRSPQLMNVPLADEGRVYGTVLRLIEELARSGHGPVRVLCHDVRDLSFASSLGGLEYVFADDVYSQLDLLRTAQLVVTFRLHAFLPCVSFGTPAINISYDERSSSMVRSIGFESWDIDFVRQADVVAEVLDRTGRLADFDELRRQAQPRIAELSATMRRAMADFAVLVREYANEACGCHPPR